MALLGLALGRREHARRGRPPCAGRCGRPAAILPPETGPAGRQASGVMQRSIAQMCRGKLITGAPGTPLMATRFCAGRRVIR